MPVVNPGAAPPAPPFGPTAPCGWTIDTSCCAEWSTYSNTVRDRATSWATEILYYLSGRQFGACEITVRPCGTGCRYYGGWMTYPVIADGIGTIFTPFIRDGSWFNCGCSGACSCEARCSVWLPGPVASVSQVTLDGVVIDPANYRVDNRNRLIGMNGVCWPDCQNMELISPDEGTFEVTYLRGKALPVSGQIAAGELACQFAKACSGQSCALPANMASLARQGIQVEMIDPTNVLTSGFTGIPSVDLWIRAVNPAGLAQRPRIYSPDVHSPTMRTA